MQPDSAAGSSVMCVGSGAGSDDVRDRQPSARSQNPKHFAEDGGLVSGDRLITQLLTTTSTDRSASGSASISPSLNSTFVARYPGGVVPRLGEHVGRHVDADDLPLWPDLLRGQESSRCLRRSRDREPLPPDAGSQRPMAYRSRGPDPRPSATPQLFRVIARSSETPSRRRRSSRDRNRRRPRCWRLARNVLELFPVPCWRSSASISHAPAPKDGATVKRTHGNDSGSHTETSGVVS